MEEKQRDAARRCGRGGGGTGGVIDVLSLRGSRALRFAEQDAVANMNVMPPAFDNSGILEVPIVLVFVCLLPKIRSGSDLSLIHI